MLKSYNLLSKCQNKLTNCDFVKGDELEIESKILELRVHLLGDSKKSLHYEEQLVSEEIKSLYEAVDKLCNGQDAVDAASNIINRLARLVSYFEK